MIGVVSAFGQGTLTGGTRLFERCYKPLRQLPQGAPIVPHSTLCLTSTAMSSSLAVVPAPLWHFPSLCCSSRWSLWSIPVFPMCHIRKKNGLPHTFSSRSVTSGNCQYAFQALLWHFLLFLIYHIRRRIGLPCTFSS